MGKTVKFTKEEVAKHVEDDSLWIILNNKVYDVSKFMLEHPGGEDVLLQWGGQDATEAFEDVGHSTDAKTMTEEYLIGEVKSADAANEPPVSPDAGVALPPPEETNRDDQTDSLWQILRSPTWSNFLIPVAISVGVYCVYTLGVRLYFRSR